MTFVTLKCLGIFFITKDGVNSIRTIVWLTIKEVEKAPFEVINSLNLSKNAAASTHSDSHTILMTDMVMSETAAMEKPTTLIFWSAATAKLLNTALVNRKNRNISGIGGGTQFQKTLF